MLSKEELTRRIIETSRVRRWYQDVPYGDIKPSDLTQCHFSDGLTNQNSCGEGRWNNYIRPMIERIRDELDTEHAILCDVGCSAGLFLLRAWQQFGFCRLIGVEGADGGYEQLLITKDYYEKMPLFTYKVTIGQAEKHIYNPATPQIDMGTFPIADLTLMSCVHYHIKAKALANYFNALSSKSYFLMVVTDENAGGVINASSSYLEPLVDIAEGWKKIDELRTPKEWLTEDRKDKYKDLTVVLFRSEVMKRLNVKECFGKQCNHNAYAKRFYVEIFPPFIDAVLKGLIDLTNCNLSEVYAWQRNSYHGSTAWPAKIASERTKSYVNMVLSIKEHGQEQPINLQEHVGMVDPWDGFHRIAVLHHLGWKYVYGKDLVLKNVRAER